MLTIDDGITTLAGDIRNDLQGRERMRIATNAFGDLDISYRLKAGKVGGIESASKTVSRRAETFHKESNTEGVEALAHKVVDALRET